MKLVCEYFRAAALAHLRSKLFLTTQELAMSHAEVR